MRRAPTLRIVPNARRWFVISAALIVLSLGSLLGRGLELSLDFVGGSSFRVEGVAETVTPDVLRTTVEGAGAAEAVAQVSGTGADRAAIVRTESLDPDGDTARAIRAALIAVTGVSEVQETFVGPTWGQRITTQSLRALIVFLLVVAVYISLRLDRKMAAVALASMAHDVLLTIGIYALVGFTVSPATVIAILTILGYSLYDTVVIFDRVKDNAHTLGEPGRRTMPELVNVSLNEVFYRSVNTTISSILPVGALLFIGGSVLGATTLQDLALALFVGMVAGAYSSLFFAGPLYAVWKSREPAEQRRITKVKAREEGASEEEAAAAIDASYSGRAPITTDYVRGTGRRGRRRR
jgi:preprotein translocase subunit SecF